MKEPLTKAEKKERIKAKNQPPVLTTLEEIGNAATHGLGAVLALIAMILLLMKSDTTWKLAASLIYGVSMCLMMLMSCLYHAFPAGSTVKRIWRRFDYTSIYLLIGGTFAPICLIYWGNTLGLVFLIIQWLLIVFGVTMILVYGPGKWPALHFTLYFLIGWSGIAFVPDMLRHDPALLAWIFAGGVIYTIGMIPFAKSGKGSHFLWHFFVLGGAILHWIGIYCCLYL